MRRNCMAEVANALGIELEEVFRIDGDEHYFMLTDTGIGMSMDLDDKDWYAAPINVLYGLLLGENEIIKLPWNPICGDRYYIPDIASADKYTSLQWFDDKPDKMHYQRGLVFKTEEEAIAVADEIISKCKERMETNG